MDNLSFYLRMVVAPGALATGLLFALGAWLETTGHLTAISAWWHWLGSHFGW
jgi:hypothetical protein